MGRSKEAGVTPGASAPEAGVRAVPSRAKPQPAAASATSASGPVNSGEKEASIAEPREVSAASPSDASAPDHPSDDRPGGEPAPDGDRADGERASEPPPPDGGNLPAVPEVRTSEERQRDLELVRRVQAGERGAFRELFDRHHRRAFAVAFGVLKHRQDALDVVQESFVKVHKHIASFQGTSSFYTWLYRIVMNLAIDQLRRRKTGRNVEYDDAVQKDGEAQSSDILPRMLDENPRKAVIRRELLQRMEAALAELPEYHRQVILLREVEGMSYEEMAEALDVPKGTIMSRLFHARKKMQSALAGYVDGDMDIEE
jgi:RNA polymerase sigma-70 factor, ECF subfamily